MKLYNATLPPYEEDTVLLARYLQTDDMEALGALYSKHAEMVYYVCLRYFRDEEKSKDSVMQIFEELITKVKKQDIKSFPKWLYVVSKNHCLMDLRSKNGTIEISIDEFVEFSADMHQEENYSEKEGKLSLLERCIEKLPEKQKIAVDLFFINEHCYKEVAEITGYSMKDVKSYIQNGKRNLKNCMDKTDE